MSRIACVLVVGIGLVATSAYGDVGAIVLVDTDAPGPVHDGQSWETAYTSLQQALAGTGEIHVAAGTYRPDDGSGDRTACFTLGFFDVVRGGYAGYGEPYPDARDTEAFETILSGDLFGNDGPDFANNAENSYHVVCATGSARTGEGRLDGVTVTKGNANGPAGDNLGAGCLVIDATPTFTNCNFIANQAWTGAGCYVEGDNPTFRNCKFIANHADNNGAGMGVHKASPTIINCSFLDARDQPSAMV